MYLLQVFLSRFVQIKTLATSPIQFQRYYTSKEGIVEDMKREIKNGVTIISTGDANGRLKNKYGHAGISFEKLSNKYRAEITHKKKKHHLGLFKDVNAAIEMRKEAEFHVKAGDFEDWLKFKKMKKGKI